MELWIQPCPNCKSDSTVCHGLNNVNYYCACLQCNIMGPDSQIKEEAIKVWNRIEIHEK